MERERRRGAAGKSSSTHQEEAGFPFHLSPLPSPSTCHSSVCTHTTSSAMRGWWCRKVNSTCLLYLMCCLCWFFAINMKLLYFHEYKSECFYSTNIVCFNYLFYFTILYWFCHTLTWICHGYTCVPHPEPSSHLPPHPIPLGHPSAPTPSTLYHASNLDWRFISHITVCFKKCLFILKIKWNYMSKILYSAWYIISAHFILYVVVCNI